MILIQSKFIKKGRVDEWTIPVQDGVRRARIILTRESWPGKDTEEIVRGHFLWDGVAGIGLSFNGGPSDGAVSSYTIGEWGISDGKGGRTIMQPQFVALRLEFMRRMKTSVTVELG